MKHLQIALLCCLQGVAVWGQEPRTDITKWQDGKLAAVSITYDDSTINQFRIAVPMMNERGLPGTFFIITGEIPGSRFMPTFVGRPIMDIIRESATVPTNSANAFERSSMLRYLGEVQRVDVVLEGFKPNSAGGLIAKGQFAPFDAVLAALRRTARRMPSARSRTCLSAPRNRGARPRCRPEG